MTQALGTVDQEDWRVVHCEKGHDEFGFGQVEFEMPMESSFLLLHFI